MELNLLEQEKVQYQFEAYCKKILREEAIDCFITLIKRREHEKSLNCLSEKEQNELYVTDNYFSDNIFTVLGFEVDVSGDFMVVALRQLPEEKLAIILLYYFIRLTDEEVGLLLNLKGTTVRYKRNVAIKLLKKTLEEFYNEKE